MGRLDGKVAVVTGAGSGIGRASAVLFAAEGARVVCADRSGREEETAGVIGDGAVAVKVDVSVAADVERMELPDVGACAVIGLPDERLGQRVAVVVQPAPGGAVDEDAIVDHCRANLARYKVPERVVVVDAFVRNAMGKIDRTTLLPLFDDPEAQ